MLAKNQNTRNVVSSLRTRFIEAANEKLDDVEAAIEGIESGNHVRQAKDIKEIVHSLKGMAGSFGFMSVTQISEAFETYLDGSIKAGLLPEIAASAYCSSMREIIDNGNEPSAADVDAIIDSLPVPVTA